jgi:hypothetical protein
MIQLHVAEECPEGTYKVMKVIRCVLHQHMLFCACQVMSKEFTRLAVCIIREEHRVAMYIGTRDIFSRVSAISGFNLFC